MSMLSEGQNKGRNTSFTESAPYQASPTRSYLRRDFTPASRTPPKREMMQVAHESMPVESSMSNRNPNYFERISAFPSNQQPRGFLVLNESERTDDLQRKPVTSTAVRTTDSISQPRRVTESQTSKSLVFESPILEYRACPGAAILEKSVERAYIKSPERRHVGQQFLPSRMAESQAFDQGQVGQTPTTAKQPLSPSRPISPITQPNSQGVSFQQSSSPRESSTASQPKTEKDKLKLYNLMITPKLIRTMEISRHGEMIYLSTPTGTEVVNMYSLKTINSDPNLQASSLKVTPSNTVAATNTATGDLELYSHSLSKITALRNPQPLPQSSF